MDFDAEKMEELLELTRENNKILRSMRKSQKVTTLFSFVYWIIILGSIFGAYYYFQPTIQRYLKVMQVSLDTLQQLEGKAGAIPSDVQMFKGLLSPTAK